MKSNIKLNLDLQAIKFTADYYKSIVKEDGNNIYLNLSALLKICGDQKFIIDTFGVNETNSELTEIEINARSRSIN